MSAWLAVVAVCVATLGVGALGLRLSRTTSDFYVASRIVSPRWNASAIGGEYISGASFLGVAGLIFASGSDMLWYSIGYTAGYLVLLALVAAPLRRSGAYTLPDFAEIRLRSAGVRRATAVLVVGIGWLYLLPQFLGAGLALRTATGAPGWVGTVIAVLVVAANVTAGGMRSVTFVQAFQYWLKLTAIALPVVLLLFAWHTDGTPSAALRDSAWSAPLNGADHPVYRTYSLLLALLFGTMGLPHVLVRLYTNPDGRAARRTVLTVIALLGAFYLFPPVYGALGRIYAGDLLGTPDAMMLLLPGRMLGEPWGEAATALLTAGAFAAFLSTSSGLTISVAGVLSQDLLRGRFRASVSGFRVGAALAVLVPATLSLLGVRTGLADTVTLAFALAASTFCPLLVLGIWWRGLTRAGALAGLATGGLLASTAVLLTVSGTVESGWPAALLGQPAAWTVPAAFAVMVAVSLLTRGSRVPGVGTIMVRLHAPESLDLNRGEPGPR
ncbi:cation acetate symporter [Kineosporia sp. J2-2]|uniref:Cation acetate symporter n=1 Tax=Kineosporia corallincola TaxID=2835133 RepID=A0ABS5TSP3_9ACTN|nr:cation acetate symporter [Kineosporia corallincola]MBT0773784.1 cation acetate symporter [Kineosporia corallincola]